MQQAPWYSKPADTMPALQQCQCGKLAYGPVAPTTRAHRGRRGLGPAQWQCMACTTYYAAAAGYLLPSGN